MLKAILYAVVTFIPVCFLSDWLFSLSDPRDGPPRAKPWIPLIGHLLGLFSYGTVYLSKVSAKQQSEVYTLGILNYKIHVINSRRLIPLVQRLSKTLSFTPFQQLTNKVLSDCTNYTVELHGDPDFMRELDKATRTALAPGTQLDSQNLKAADILVKSVDDLASDCSGSKPVRIQFWDWSTHVVTIASTNGVYGGSSNPFLKRELEETFWDYNGGIPTLMTGYGKFAPKAWRAREKLIEAFTEYLRSNPEDAAEVIKERIRVPREHGSPEIDIARMLVSFNIALLPNTTSTAFWTLYNIFSSPSLIRDLREELETIAVRYNASESAFELDVAAVKTKCKLLLYTLEETQRAQTIHANIRKVMEDTTIDNFRLQKGSYVQIPNAPIHYNTEIWGKDSSEFNPQRFLRQEKGGPLASSLPSHAFLAWGAAPHLCPARQFASTEILVLAALLILRVEIAPVGPRWVRPALKLGDLVVMAPPKNDIEVEVRQRESWNGKWNLIMGESKSRVPLASG